ncbi:Pre-rRNA-processing protein ipi1 [Cladophialophora carrionii]|uniref:Pre-rRNA-processing protein n=1 Tax=Cladophialophora carrionii TaxID=86049 RepID=A0A1C1D2K5_9EURO|nr:Pre-rRNA-processing protein ipi1 [Cladophialophora carrionii]
MGSSAKKKREKKKDFQKQKLKVGKTRPKADNHTDTSFRAKAIVLNQQLDVAAPTQSAVFLHQVSLLNSRSDVQRKDALAHLTNYIAASSSEEALPITTSSLLGSIFPLILDGSSGVRNQLLKLLHALPQEDVRDHVSRALPYVRAGMTHLSRDVRATAIDFLSFLIRIAGTELVSCPGGWHQTLECFTTVLGWRSASSKASFAGDVRSTARILNVLSDFLQAGLLTDKLSSSEPNSLVTAFPLWRVETLLVPTKSSAYAHLNLFGPQAEDDSQILDEQEDRLQNFTRHFRDPVLAGIEAARKEGGELGRAAGLVVKTLERAQNT